MPSMIETLISNGLTRPDEKRLVPTRRPLPSRPRDLLELFVVLGQEASIPSVFQSCDLRQADARHLTYVALSRWPTEPELHNLPTPYHARNHLRALLLGQEFRTSVIRRICDAYPERPRLLYVQIPRCAGHHFQAMANTMHAIVPPGLAQWRPKDKDAFIVALGTYLGRFNSARSIMVIRPQLMPFIQGTEPPPQDRDPETDLLWALNPPPRRSGDRLFTIVREPRSLVLSQINAILTSLKNSSDPNALESREITAWRTRLGRIPANKIALKALVPAILENLPAGNPICTALGDGTAASATQACRLSDIEIVSLPRYPDWIKYSWDVEPEPAVNVSTPFLTLEDVGDALDGHVAEDLKFFAPIEKASASLSELKTALRGRDL